MPSNIRQFELDMRRFGKEIVPNAVSILERKIALFVLQGIVLKTPVDTGRAKGNWLVSVNSVPEGTIAIENLSSERAASFALNKGIPVIESSRPFGFTAIANNLPYIGILEFGRSDGRPGSKQAPEGMVRVTLAELQTAFG